ncbi:amidohydrolase family protein [Candidatus Palauibacter sp.]|uniref:amidohydrolase family protein n=1 Tax=Candidatus Palauibacter sp. TaxID=3101350 RepID=UPI003B521FE2
MRAIRASFVLCGMLAGVASLQAQDRWMAIEGGTVFDGTGAVHEDATVLVRNDRVEGIGPAGQIEIPAGAERIDATGKFLTPGFIDLHFHYSPGPHASIDGTGTDANPELPLLFLANGVTTQREMGQWIMDNENWLTTVRTLGLPVPRLLYSGPILDGRDTAYPTISRVLLDEMDARLAANELMDAGATSLKVYFRLSLAQVAAIIEEADRRNVPVHGHLEIVDPIAAIRLGLDGIEHTRSVGRALVSPKRAEEFRQAVLRESIHRGEGGLALWATLDPAGPRADALIELMLERNVNLDGTLAVFEPAFDEEGRDVQWAAMRNMGAFTVRYAKAGGPVTMGSHGLVANARPGLAYQREMETHVEAGMTPAETLIAATRMGAEALRLPDRGILAHGMLADIVLFDASPLEDITNARRVHAVILGGRVLDRDRLLGTAEGLVP